MLTASFRWLRPPPRSQPHLRHPWPPLTPHSQACSESCSLCLQNVPRRSHFSPPPWPHSKLPSQSLGCSCLSLSYGLPVSTLAPQCRSQGALIKTRLSSQQPSAQNPASGKAQVLYKGPVQPEKLLPVALPPHVLTPPHSAFFSPKENHMVVSFFLLLKKKVMRWS